MNYFLLLLLILFCLVYWHYDDVRNFFWQRKYAHKRLSERQRHLIAMALPIYNKMQPHQQQALEKHIIWFLDHIGFLGCDGLAVTDDMKLIVAANACVLVINKPWPIFRNVKQVLLYPSAYYANESSVDGVGLVRHHQVVRQGESWPGGTLVLSWHDVKEGIRLPEDGHNLVYHEFAHQLDQETGSTTGTPKLLSKAQYARWAKEFSYGFNLLKTQLAYGIPNAIHSYGATNEAEFFAVVTETFIEQPTNLRLAHPAIYELLSEYYGFEPEKWR